MKTCSKCGFEKELNEFSRDKKSRGGKASACKKCRSLAHKTYYQSHRSQSFARVGQFLRNNPTIKLWYAARSRAKKLGRPFNIESSDIILPEFCPVFGVKLEPGCGQAQYNSPTIDCFIPKLGYVKGNISVISHRANTIKHDAALDELRKVVSWMEKN